MKRLLPLCLAALFMASLASAQYTPHYEFFVGGSDLFMHGNGSEVADMLGISQVQLQPHNINLDMPGWNVSFGENANQIWGLEMNAAGYYRSPAVNFLFPATQLVSPTPDFNMHVPLATQYQAYLMGPKFTLRRTARMTIFAHVPVGVALINTRLNESAVVASDFHVLPAGKVNSDSSFAMSPGFGVDFRLSPKVMFRPVQIDYLMSHLFGSRQDSFRYSAGVNLTFGEK